MEDRRRTFLAIAIVGVVLLAVLSSFFPTFLGKHPSIELADPDAVNTRNPGLSETGDVGDITVQIDTNTVQAVIASLERYTSYSRTVSADYFDDTGGFLGTVRATVWADGGWTHTSVLTNSGTVEQSIVGDGKVWLWYDDGEDVYTGPAGEEAEDRMQRLPTYEDVLALDKSAITDAGFTDWSGQPCIYVEATFPLLGNTERYWISEASGLLMAAETESDGVLVYSMSSYDVVSPLGQASGAFTLPDGTVLHRK